MNDVKDSLARLKKANEENQTPIMVTRGLLKAALSEIEMQSKVNGGTFATGMVLSRLKRALGISE